MANITIYLKVDEVGHLHLRDSEGHSGEDNITTEVNDGDSVIWTLDDNSGISMITGIEAKPGSENLFGQGPSAVSDTEWSGVISPSASGEESYTIYYNLSDGSPKQDDPKIIVRPT